MTREEFLSKSIKPRSVELPEWETSVFVRAMTTAERFGWSAVVTKDETDAANNLMALLVRCICDESGLRLLTDADTEALAGKDFVVLDRIGKVAMELNGIGAAQTELQKNS